jgi:hypothetical protein
VTLINFFFSYYLESTQSQVMLNAHNVKNVSFSDNGKGDKFQKVIFIYAITLTVETSKLLSRT